MPLQMSVGLVGSSDPMVHGNRWTARCLVMYAPRAARDRCPFPVNSRPLDHLVCGGLTMSCIRPKLPGQGTAIRLRHSESRKYHHTLLISVQYKASEISGVEGQPRQITRSLDQTGRKRSTDSESKHPQQFALLPMPIRENYPKRPLHSTTVNSKVSTVASLKEFCRPTNVPVKVVKLVDPTIDSIVRISASTKYEYKECHVVDKTGGIGNVDPFAGSRALLLSVRAKLLPTLQLSIASNFFTASSHSGAMWRPR